MNATQSKYVKSRAQTIYNKRRQAIDEKYKVVKMPLADRVKALKNHQFKVLDVKPDDRQYNGIEQYIVFDKQPKVDEKAKQAEMDALTEEYTALTDELVLGDNEQALAMLRAFDK